MQPSLVNSKNPSEPSHQGLFGQRVFGLPFKKAGLIGLCAFSLCAGLVLVLGMPELSKAFGISSDSPMVADVSAYLQGNPAPTNTTRVADQNDPARAETFKISKDNTQIATFFAKKYRLAASEIEKYLHFAELAGKAKGVDATLIMAVMSIESNLNAITQSSAGAQGLMQVLTAVHLDKLAAYGGPDKAFDPEANIMVGATILADCIKLGGSVEMGLKCYVGATGPTDGGYGAKVLAEQERIEKARVGVFDFSANNKVLVDMGLIAAPVVTETVATSPSSPSSLPPYSPSSAPSSSAQNTVQTYSSAIMTTAPLAAPSPAAAPSVLPQPLSVTLPAPAVNAAALHNPALHDAQANASAAKQK